MNALDQLFAAAKTARHEGRAADALPLLLEAKRHAENPEQIVLAGWRLAKLRWDLGQDDVLDALDDALALPDPFFDYPQALTAVESIARRAWDTRGYGDPRVIRLWDAYTQAQFAQGDAYLAYAGQVQRAWHLACRGLTVELSHQLTQAHDHWSTASIAASPTRHPDAPSAEASLPFLFRDLAYTACWGGLWADDQPLCQRALRLYEDALDDIAPETDPWWFVECQGRYALQYGGVAAHVDAWLTRSASLQGPRARYHRLMATGLTGAPSELREAAKLATDDAYGPEWVADALAQAQRRGDAQATSRLAELVRRYHVDAFAHLTDERQT